ncbi:MAG: branched-chain amino acid ABC transporter substrate-binding protein [Deltaproteobacteria bacterium]|jgi:branched-chain amino acid transport system substrate-binding protein|nr:branched-chain amino acid ABC transporter substrate-binding protein [Deltaproteobacteria bacterium]
MPKPSALPRPRTLAVAAVIVPVFLAGLFTAFSGKYSQAQDPKKFQLGFGGALLGNLATYGLSNFYGLEYAVLKANALSGVMGQQVEIVTEDDSCNPAMASAAATKLISSGLKIIMGHSCSGATRSALSVYGNNVLLISSSATETSLTESGQYPYFFRTTPRDDVQVKLQLALIKKKGFKKIAILHDKGDHGQTVAELTRDLIKAQGQNGPELVIYEGLTAGQISFDAIISKIKDAQAEAVVWCGYYNDAAKLVTQMRQKRVTTAMIGFDGLYDPRYVNIAQQAAEGTYCTGQVDYSRNQAAKEALADHQKRHSEDVGSYFFYAIGAAQALFAALDKTNNPEDFAGIKKHLNEDTVETVIGPVRFDTKGDVIGAGFKVFLIQQGRYTEVAL